MKETIMNLGETTPDTLLDAFRTRMGMQPDGEIAALAGVSRVAVLAYRRRNNIEGYVGHRFASRAPAEPEIHYTAPDADLARTDTKTGSPRASRLDAYAEIVGVLPDREVAERVGVTSENVRHYRLRRGIPAGWRGEAASAVAPIVEVPEITPVVEARVEPTPVVAPTPVVVSAVSVVVRPAVHVAMGFRVSIRGADGAVHTCVSVGENVVDVIRRIEPAVVAMGGDLVGIEHVSPAIVAGA